jgi:hypothetical protein
MMTTRTQPPTSLERRKPAERSVKVVEEERLARVVGVLLDNTMLEALSLEARVPGMVTTPRQPRRCRSLRGQAGATFMREMIP